jgi:hypothetical protein
MNADMALRATLKDETVPESRLKGGCSQDWLPHSTVFSEQRGY